MTFLFSSIISCNQSLTQDYQSVIQSLSLILHPVQQSNPVMRKMDTMANKMMDMMPETMMVD